MTANWTVTYPGITQDLTRDFDTKEAAEAFAKARRDRELHMWRHVKVEEKMDRRPVHTYATTRPGDAAAIYAEETGLDYSTALVHCNMD